MPPASAVNSANNAAAQAASKAEREQRLRDALKDFIQKERQRKKEEFEAKVEEERLRKEREARERQNDMTLEETRRQIAKLDQELTDLRNQKQQLFLQYKKVLNEDENRKKQQKDNEMYAMQALQVPNVPQVFMPPVRLQHHQINQPLGNQPVKRGRSPSPPHQGYYKNSTYSQQKHDDGRRGADYARVLWNKAPTQYQNPGTLFYQTTSTAPPPPQQPDNRGAAIIYPAYNLPLRQGYHLELQPTAAGKNDAQSQKSTPIYHINLEHPPISQASAVNAAAAGISAQKPHVTMEKISERYHVDVKHDGPTTHGPPPPHQLTENVVYAPLIPGMTLHPNVMQMTAANAAQNSKGGASITQGYAAGRSAAAAAHEQQLARQQQMSVLQAQPGQQPPQRQHFHAHGRLF